MIQDKLVQDAKDAIKKVYHPSGSDRVRVGDRDGKYQVKGDLEGRKMIGSFWYVAGVVAGVFWLLTIATSTSTTQHITTGVLMLFAAIHIARHEIMREIRKVSSER